MSTGVALSRNARVSNVADEHQNTMNASRAGCAGEWVAAARGRSSRQPTRGSSTTAPTLSAAQVTASPKANESSRPKKSPLPSTAIDCHHNVKLAAILPADASIVVLSPGSGVTLNADIPASVTTH